MNDYIKREANSPSQKELAKMSSKNSDNVSETENNSLPDQKTKMTLSERVKFTSIILAMLVGLALAQCSGVLDNL